jgi:hypothetical protein
MIEYHLLNQNHLLNSDKSIVEDFFKEALVRSLPRKEFDTNRRYLVAGLSSNIMNDGEFTTGTNNFILIDIDECLMFVIEHSNLPKNISDFYPENIFTGKVNPTYIGDIISNGHTYFSADDEELKKILKKQ